MVIFMVSSATDAIAAEGEACDCHLHVFAVPPGPDRQGPIGMGVDDYRKRRDPLGLSRAVIVQPRKYGFDNQVLVDSIATLGRDSTRGVAVISPDVTDAELRDLDKAGVRGARFSLFSMKNATVSFDMLEPVAARIASMGWHLQLHWTADQIVEHSALLDRLPSEIVFDHMARLPVSTGASHKAFDIVAGLIAAGRAWVKLSGLYLESRVGSKGNFEDMAPIPRAWIGCDVNRMVWGSDWPHLDDPEVSDRLLLNLLADWAGDQETLRRILVDNPKHLYGF
jgi:predicted TIM-barrel fold metal-dependent hydrolase